VDHKVVTSRLQLISHSLGRRSALEIITLRSWKRPLLFVLGAVACVLLYLFLLNFPPIGIRSPTAGVIPVVILAATTAGLTARFLRAEGWSTAVLGLSQAHHPLAMFASGALAGSALTGAWMAIVTLATGAAWHLNPSFSAVALALACLFNLFNNIGEELVYRGYLFLRLMAAWGATAAALATSAAFAMLHLQAGLPWLSVLAAVFTSGVIFAAIFARWRSLPLALGFHVATNIVQDATGMRPSAASLLAAEYPVGSAGKGQAILVSIALLNLTVALVLLFWSRRSRGLTTA
jgi:membrane protease YdiL (CAAX protease family)